MVNNFNKYLIIISFGFAIDVLCFIGFLKFGFSPYSSNIFSFCIGLTLNVTLLRVFLNKTNKFKFHIDLLITFISNGAVIFIGTGLVWFFINKFNLNPFESKIISNGITVVINLITRLKFF
jgi:hypothetical protein